MENEMRRWVGYLRGSRTATLFLNMHSDDEATLVLGFTGGGDLRLIVAKETEGPQVSLLLEETRQPFGSAVIEQETADLIKGTWRFLSGAEGVFEIGREKSDAQNSAQVADMDQLRNREIPLGAITLYRTDLDRLIAELESLVPAPNVTTIRAVENDQIVIEQATRFLARKDYIDVVRSMTISTTEITAAPLKKVANIILNDDGSSQIVISSTDELWTEAAASRLTKYVNQFSSRLTGLLRKHGLNINSFILVAIIIWMPDRPLIERVVVFAIGIILIFGIAKSHSLLPYNRVYLDPNRQKKPFAKEIPGATMAAVAGIVTAGLSAAPGLFQAARRMIEGFVAWLSG